MEGKIFVLSLHRTATQSVHDLLKRSGLAAVHWPAYFDGIDYQSRIIGKEDDLHFVADVLAPVFARATAFSDVPIPALYRVLDAQFRGAKFLAVRRPATDWVRSVRRHCANRKLNPYEKTQYFQYLPNHPDSLADVSDEELIDMHRKHYAAISNFFALRVNFGLFELSDPKLGPRICGFLGRAPIEMRHVDTVGYKRAAQT